MRFTHKLVSAHAKTMQTRTKSSVTRQDHDGHIHVGGIAANLPEQFNAVSIGKRQIQNNEINGLSVTRLHQGAPSRIERWYRRHAKPSFTEFCRDDHSDCRAVIHQKYMGTWHG
jgi:hypothetical protein